MVSARAAALHALVALDKGRSDRLRDGLDALAIERRELPLAYELAHGVVRRQRLLDHVVHGLAHRGIPKDPVLLTALRLGVYQMLFVAGMPAHAAVHETVALVRSNKGFVNAVLRRLAQFVDLRPADPLRAREELALGPTRTLQLPQPLPDDEHERLAIVHSLPTWLCERFGKEHGADGLRRIAAAASAVPPVFLRLSPGVDAALLRDALAAVRVTTVVSPDARFLRWTDGESPFATAAFAAGRFVVQDPTAFAAAAAVPCRPGDTVVDLCAAPGTKTTWLAPQVRPGGTVFAFDSDAVRRRRIDQNIERLSLQDAARVVDGVADLPPADAVLADVPCSNSGVLGRRVEVRRRITPETFARMAVVQRDLLRQALGLAKPGGHVVYSTCSIDREENENVLAAVLARADGPPAEVLRSELSLPLAGEHDGGFFAVIRRLS
ncbi:MAG: transcription antitermination factor NusB [Planctomycetota bacterium]